MYSFRTRVRYSEITEDRKCSMVAIVNYLQDCVTFESEDGGVGLDWRAATHTAWLLADWQIHVNQRPFFGENIEVSTWATEFRSFLGKRAFTIRDTDTGELLVYAVSDWAYMHMDTGMPEREVPRKELAVFGTGEPLQEPLIRGRLRVPRDMTVADPLTVTELNLDTNHHLNNAQYLVLAVSVLPAEAFVKSDFRLIRADYKRQSMLGDVLYPSYKEQDGGWCVVLRDKEGKVCLNAFFG